jgi:hypothetical protein
MSELGLQICVRNQMTKTSRASLSVTRRVPISDAEVGPSRKQTFFRNHMSPPG